MDEQFWQSRWAQNQIGFHLREINPYLERYWPKLGLAQGCQVLVPLCGKTLDLVWLAGQGHKVLGVELAERAVEDFFTEQGLTPDVSQQGALRRYSMGDIEILQGDFFAVTAADVADCQALYDRAALIALPPSMRDDYMAHLHRILPARCDGLMVTLDYEQARLEGPPFSVPESEVRRHLAASWEVEMLERNDVLEKNWKFASRGLDSLHEPVFRLRRR
ncbi:MULTISPECIES: thiopurine S-methyltransferase [unclassified Pseudomonas]|jgi:thiopurine S-methyltransferase|uniref:thiopurine S-methyltransferase n=1 Tax=unclassified Pseudomonas TaxID=196821 RepID=UPI000EA8E92F|nr:MULTISPECIES: thiopurine S-methyltransferase [unclassified Pseudomonas]AYF87177.1 thiopurine S-methyltransferase [Pseudomonas sp. DY-1]MDH4656934.1 thiopurine S-methyltransferase [Pseudomonas sp. BN606]MRK22191.1 thiopurine S-methyltransferase [Pseudomonas sp. JG-B]